MVHFGEFLKTWSLRSNRVTRQVSFNTTKIGGKCQNSNATFWITFKQYAGATLAILGVKIQMRHFLAIFKHCDSRRQRCAFRRISTSPLIISICASSSPKVNWYWFDLALYTVWPVIKILAGKFKFISNASIQLQVGRLLGWEYMSCASLV